MKKFLFFVFALGLLLSVSSAAFADMNIASSDERLIERENGMVIRDTQKIIHTQIPDPGATIGEVDSIASKHQRILEKKLLGTKKNPGGVIGELGKKIDAKDTATATAITTAGTDTASAIETAGKNTATAIETAGQNTAGAITKQSGKIDGIILAIKEAKRQIFWALAILGTVLIIVFLTYAYASWPEKKGSTVGDEILSLVKAVDQKADAIEKKIDQVPAETAKVVKTLEPITIDFTVRGKNVSYTPPIVNGTYLSLYVPKTVREEVDDPSKIIRLPIDHRGKLYKSTLEVIAAFLDGEFNGPDVHSRQQKELVRFAQAIGQLKIS